MAGQDTPTVPIVAVKVHVLLHPSFDTVTVNMYEPDAPARTFTEEPVFGPMIEPLPEMAQLKLDPLRLLVTL